MSERERETTTLYASLILCIQRIISLSLNFFLSQMNFVNVLYGEFKPIEAEFMTHNREKEGF
jgi:hypothetical protein